MAAMNIVLDMVASLPDGRYRSVHINISVGEKGEKRG